MVLVASGYNRPIHASTSALKGNIMSRRYDRRRKQYGFWNLVIDVGLTIITGGLWLIVVLIRYLGRNS